MRRFDLLFFDLDGTLLGPDHKNVSLRNQQALHDAQAAGVRLSIATGRCLTMVPEPVKALGVDYAITSNGAVVYDFKQYKQLYRYDFPVERAAEALDIVGRHMVYYELFIDGGVKLVRSPLGEAEGLTEPPWNRFYLERRGAVPPMLDVDEYLAAGVPGLEKINLIHCEPEALIAMKNELMETGRFDLSSSLGYGGLEIMPVECSKGSSLEWLCRYSGTTVDCCAAFGDGNNDRGMLAAAGCGVAMGNAPDNLKAEADAVTLPYDEDGIAAFIEAYVL